MNAIEIQNLDYEISGKKILQGINLEVELGEILAIMGMSGSGKTSLLKCISGLRKPSTGIIRLSGKDIVPLSEQQMDGIRLKIGLVFQYAALFDSMTVFDNVSFGLRQHRHLKHDELSLLVSSRLEEVEMEGTEKLFPSELSGGMQKRVGLARALAMEPEILLYDEPTSGLDPVIARNIDDLIVRTKERTGTSSVVVSHDISSIFRIADRIAMLDEGELIAVGTPAEIRESKDSRVQKFVDAGSSGGWK